jgi:hypothetical protein
MQGSSSGGSSRRDGGGSKLEVNAYAKVDARLPEKHRGCTPVMVSITGPSSATTMQRAPIDVVLVLHVNVRCKTPAKWHDLLNQATQHLVGRLGEDDRLAIVPALLKETRIIFEDAVVVPVKPKLLPMSDENKAAACNSVESSEAMRSNTQLARDLESAEEVCPMNIVRTCMLSLIYIIVSSTIYYSLTHILIIGVTNELHARSRSYLVGNPT